MTTYTCSLWHSYSWCCHQSQHLVCLSKIGRDMAWAELMALLAFVFAAAADTNPGLKGSPKEDDFPLSSFREQCSLLSYSSLNSLIVPVYHWERWMHAAGSGFGCLLDLHWRFPSTWLLVQRSAHMTLPIFMLFPPWGLVPFSHLYCLDQGHPWAGPGHKKWTEFGSWREEWLGFGLKLSFLWCTTEPTSTQCKRHTCRTQWEDVAFWFLLHLIDALLKSRDLSIFHGVRSLQWEES